MDVLVGSAVAVVVSSLATIVLLELPALQETVLGDRRLPEYLGGLAFVGLIYGASVLWSVLDDDRSDESTAAPHARRADEKSADVLAEEREEHLASIRDRSGLAGPDSDVDSEGPRVSTEAVIEATVERPESRSIPQEIPSVPELNVDYGALTDREPIGTGGNAEVTRATLPTPGGDVSLAIKEPRLSGTLHADRAERILAEAVTWDGLDDHDHVVGVVDYSAEPLPWIAMEYMHAGDLNERAGELSVEQALWTGLALTEGVRHAHTRGVVHLDLKPANVLFRSVEDAWDVPKVADWGLSEHLLDRSRSDEGLSPHYAAPEQFDPEYEPTDHVSDIYQLGCYSTNCSPDHDPSTGDRTM
jgi:hypothetical protein